MAEVVGLVLGVIPLLISGLEHYAEGVRTIESIRNASAHFREYKRALGTERAIFENNLRFLLENDLDGAFVDKMFDNVEDPCWADLDVERCLKRRLGRSYDAFFDTAKAINVITVKMMKYLQLDKDGKGPFDSKDMNSVRRGCSRLKFGMRIKKYKELLNEIVIENQRLNTLSQLSRDLESIRESKVSAPDFEMGREHARSLFAALQDQSPASCELGHSIGMFLNPAAASGTTKLYKISSRRLRAVFTHGYNDTTQPPPSWLLEETEVEPLLSDSDSEDDMHPRSSTVRFAVPETAPGARGTQQRPSEILDICASLHSTKSLLLKQDTCFGYLSDPHVNHRHGLYRPSNPVVNARSSAVALAQILDRRDTYRLGPKDKRVLALNLALGMLRLHNTPWLKQQWGRHEVCLFHQTGNLAVAHPFISMDIWASRAQRSVPPTKYFRTCKPIIEPTLFALGILLIELALEAPFESLILPEDCNPDGTRHKLTDFYAASRLVDDVYQIAEFRYGTVVKRCINCEFDHPPKQSSLLDGEFRKKVYRGVVESLQQDVDDVKNI